jgi:hypothetical protein
MSVRTLNFEYDSMCHRRLCFERREELEPPLLKNAILDTLCPSFEIAAGVGGAAL